MYLLLRWVKVGQRFELCRTGEVFTLVAAGPETPYGYKRECRGSDGRLARLHYACNVRVIPNAQG